VSGIVRTIGIAVIGAGYWGPNLTRNAQASEKGRLRWVCDLDREQAARAVGAGTARFA
jgi:hypothetical protein